METNSTYRYSDMVPFDSGILSTRLKTRKMSYVDLVNQPSVNFTRNQLFYFKRRGEIPKEYSDQIEEALINFNPMRSKCGLYHRYNGEMVAFGASELNELKEKCKKFNTSLTHVLNVEHISSETL